MSRSDVATEQHQAMPYSLSMKDVKLRESCGNEFRIVFPAGTSPERLGESSFYATVAHLFQPYDELILIDTGRTVYHRRLVLQSGHGYCETHPLYSVQLPALMCAVGERLPSNHRIVWTGPETGWSAIRNSDGIVIVSLAQSQSACLEELLNHASLQK